MERNHAPNALERRLLRLHESAVHGSEMAKGKLLQLVRMDDGAARFVIKDLEVGKLVVDSEGYTLAHAAVMWSKRAAGLALRKRDASAILDDYGWSVSQEAWATLND